VRTGRSHAPAPGCSGATARIGPPTLSLAALPIVRLRRKWDDVGQAAGEVDGKREFLVSHPGQARRKSNSLEHGVGMHYLPAKRRRAGPSPGRGQPGFTLRTGFLGHELTGDGLRSWAPPSRATGRTVVCRPAPCCHVPHTVPAAGIAPVHVGAPMLSSGSDAGRRGARVILPRLAVGAQEARLLFAFCALPRTGSPMLAGFCRFTDHDLPVLAQVLRVVPADSRRAGAMVAASASCRGPGVWAPGPRGPSCVIGRTRTRTNRRAPGVSE
jgi:hypothetical protein